MTDIYNLKFDRNSTGIYPIMTRLIVIGRDPKISE